MRQTIPQLLAEIHAQPQEPAPPKLKQRISKQRRKRLDRDAEYRAIVDIFATDNPTCAECGEPFHSFHHIARGNDRAKSLTNTDLGMGGCKKHHDEWDDKGKCPVAKQFAIKFKSILRRYAEITGKRVTVNDVQKWLED